MLWHRYIDAVNMVYQIVSYLIEVGVVYLVIKNIWDDPNARLAPLVNRCIGCITVTRGR